MTKKYSQHFRAQWLTDPRFQKWLVRVDGDDKKCFCEYCRCLLSAKVSDIEKHSKTAKHRQAEEHPLIIQKYAGTQKTFFAAKKAAPKRSHSQQGVVEEEPQRKMLKQRNREETRHNKRDTEKNEDEESQEKISRQMMHFYKLEHSDHKAVVLRSLANDECFMDVTLTAEGKALRAHKSVLSAMSAYFRRVLTENPCQHPIIVMPRDITFDELRNLVSYIYEGEVSVPFIAISSFLKTARTFEITGLSELEVEGEDEAVESCAAEEPSITLQETDQEMELQEHSDGAVLTAGAKKVKIGRSPRKRLCQKKPKEELLDEADTEEEMTAAVKGAVPGPTRSRLPSNEPSASAPEGGTAPLVDAEDLVLPPGAVHGESIRLFMCECTSVFMQQSALDRHKKGCRPAGAKAKKSLQS